MSQAIRVIDSHTGGEPTRLVIDGQPPVVAENAKEARYLLNRHWDHYRTAIIDEPRSSDIVVGAYLFPSSRADVVGQLVFFNNVGYLGMCGHGTIGVVATLRWLNRLNAGTHKFDTPVGDITVEAHADGSVTIANVPSYRYRQGVAVDVPGFGLLHGDIAWGGNWFFLVDDHGLRVHYDNITTLQRCAESIREILQQEGITGANNEEIDHIELFGAGDDDSDSRNFVLCPGLAYDRSPCGTGTSAKIACLAADGKLQPQQRWRQQSIVGSCFDARYEMDADQVRPYVRGSAHIVADASLILDPNDPYCWGISNTFQRG